MPVQALEHERISVEPHVLLSLTKVCRIGWEDYVQRKHNGLTDQMRQQLMEEFHFMKVVVRHLIPEDPVRVEDRAIVYDPSMMEENKIYPVEVDGGLYLVRKTGQNTVETYELEPIE